MESNKFCVTLDNISIEQGVVSLRITSLLGNQPQQDCYIYYNMINAFIEEVEIPVKMIFMTSLGQLVDSKWNGAMGQLANNETDVRLFIVSTVTTFPFQ